MINCLNISCKRQCQLYLCNDCTGVLRSMLAQLPWLLDELDARIQKLDRVPHGTIGRVRKPSGFENIDWAAAETAREIRNMLRQWVSTISERHSGRRAPALDAMATRDFAAWLQVNVEAIARLDCAGEVYHDINQLVGSSSKGDGRIVKAINKHERHFAGPCPTIVGYDNTGEPIECGQELYGDSDDRTVMCPECGQEIDAERNRRKVVADRDLMTEDTLLETLANVGEPVEPRKLEAWIADRRLRPYGWLHQGVIVKSRVRKDDLALYSFDRARKLGRMADEPVGERKLGRPGALTDEQEREALAMIAAGGSTRTVAKHFGCNKDSIRRLIKRCSDDTPRVQVLVDSGAKLAH